METFSKYRYQQGATLIVVMVVLLIITIMGVMSVRKSRTNLAIANSSDVQTILFQGSDLALSKMEEETRDYGSDNLSYLVGYANTNLVKNPEADYEIVICLRPLKKKGLLDKSKISRIRAKDQLYIQQGFCSLSQDGDYTNQRKVSLTQVAISKGKPRLDPEVRSDGTKVYEPVFTNKVEGQDMGSSGVDASGGVITIHSVTLMPAFSSAKAADIEECLKNRVMNDYDDPANIETVSDCLMGLGVPTRTQVQVYGIAA